MVCSLSLFSSVVFFGFKANNRILAKQILPPLLRVIGTKKGLMKDPMKVPLEEMKARRWREAESAGRWMNVPSYLIQEMWSRIERYCSGMKQKSKSGQKRPRTLETKPYINLQIQLLAMSQGKKRLKCGSGPVSSGRAWVGVKSKYLELDPLLSRDFGQFKQNKFAAVGSPWSQKTEMRQNLSSPSSRLDSMLKVQKKLSKEMFRERESLTTNSWKHEQWLNFFERGRKTEQQQEQRFQRA